jgi:glycosyltransferase involved in cell wall biosynthesis
MRVGIYAQTAKEKEPRGVGYHVRNLIEALARTSRQHEYFLYYQCGLRERDTYRDVFPRAAHVHPRAVRFPDGWTESRPNLWLNRYLPWVLRRDRIDVFHCPNHFLPKFAAGRTVVTIHDLAYFKMEVYERSVNDAFREWTRKALDAAGGVIAISENTRADLHSLGVDPAKIRLIYGGGHVVPEDQIAWRREDELRAQFGLRGPYILFLGTLGLRKNVQFLIRAFADLKQRMRLPHKLVIAGKKFMGIEELEALVAELGVGHDVIFTGYVDAWQVPLLYKLADLFVLPTLYEGFTLVTLEAMAYGTPVIATDTSSIREGTGDAALLVPVNDVDALSKAMRDVLTDPALKTSMIEKGKIQQRKFTWENCAVETAALYEDLFNNAATARRAVLARAQRPAPS